MNTLPTIEKLAVMMRQQGWHRVGADRLEEKLGRKLTKFERRAIIMATDSKARQCGIKLAHSKRQQAIHDGMQSKQARLPRPISIDQPTDRIVPQKAFSNTSKVEPESPYRARYAHIEGFQYPEQAALARKAVRQQRQPAKAEEWDKKR